MFLVFHSAWTGELVNDLALDEEFILFISRGESTSVKYCMRQKVQALLFKDYLAQWSDADIYSCFALEIFHVRMSQYESSIWIS